MNIKKSDLVLEIGPGGYPYWRADLVADKYTPADKGIDKAQFGDVELKIGDKPFFLIKENILPFKPKSIDYTVCSHVLEHVRAEELELLISEIFRISNRAYLEFPTFLYEWNYNIDVHTNFLDIVDGRIICLPKEKSILKNKTPLSAAVFKLRKRNRFDLEVAYPGLCATGEEFLTCPEVVIVETEKEFIDLIQPKYLEQNFQVLPTKMWFYKEKIRKIMWDINKKKRNAQIRLKAL